MQTIIFHCQLLKFIIIVYFQLLIFLILFNSPFPSSVFDTVLFFFRSPPRGLVFDILNLKVSCISVIIANLTIPR